MITTSKTIEIPGFTVGIKGNELADPILSLDSTINGIKTVIIPVILVNYGKFDQNLTGFLFNNSCFKTNISYPVNLKPGDTLKLNIEYSSSVPTFITDTFKISNKCGIRPLIQLNINYSGCGGNSFVFSDFASPKNLNLTAKARISNDYVRLTQALSNQVGAMWYSQKVQVDKSFTTNFIFRLSQGNNAASKENSLPGADGIAFVIQDVSNNEHGGNGGDIGYSGIPKSLAVEFDLFTNDSQQIENYNDPNGNHIAVQSNGININSAIHSPVTTLGMNDKYLEIRADSSLYNVRIDYNIKPGTLRVFIGNKDNPLKQYLAVDNLDLPDLLGLGDHRTAYIGITSATGEASQNHDILYWDYCSEFVSDAGDDSQKNTETNSIINVYPNPNNGIFNLSFKNYNEYDLIISDVLGKIIYTNKIKNENEKIDLSSQPKGIYIVKLISERNIFFRKIILN